MCGSGNRTSCTCSGFCFRLYIVGVVVDQNADILQLLDLVGIHGVVPKVHPDEHDARFQLCDRFDPIIVSIDEIDGKISFQTGKIFISCEKQERYRRRNLLGGQIAANSIYQISN